MKNLPARRVLLWTALLAAAIEGVTLLFRFGFHLQATRDTASTVGVLTGGLRIHHGYFGLLALPVAAALWRAARPLAQRVLILGLALILSDLAHHFLLLWPIVGDPEFHLVYPPA
jgi:hypothetical protein